MAMTSRTRSRGTAAETFAGRFILIVTGIVLLLGGLGAAAKSTYDNWKWVKEVFAAASTPSPGSPSNARNNECGNLPEDACDLLGKWIQEMRK